MGTIPLAILTDASNNVGIGGSPSGSYKLEVTGTSNFTGALRTASTINMTGTNAQLLQTVSNSVAGDNVAVLYNSNANSYGLYIGAGTGTNHALYITNAARNADLFKVQGNGNVGIGTSSPQINLHLLTGGTAFSSTTTYSSSTSRGILLEQSNGASSNGNAIWFNNSGLYSAIASTRESTEDWGTDLRFFTHPQVTSNQFDVTERMRIKSDGNVGIGTTNPTRKLHISATNNGVFEGILVENTASNWYALYQCKTGSSGIWQWGVWLDNGYRVGVSGVADYLQISSSGAVTIPGSLSKGSGSFRIEHPLESLSKTHQLVHSFIEGPQADLIYRGVLTLVNGKAQANIDIVSNMTEGTFESLCREVQCFTTNESGWDLVKGKVIGNIIYIESQNTNSSDEISWMVIGDRKDKHMMDTEWTDDNGKVIVEPLKPIELTMPSEELNERLNKAGL